MGTVERAKRIDKIINNYTVTPFDEVTRILDAATKKTVSSYASPAGRKRNERVKAKYGENTARVERSTDIPTAKRALRGSYFKVKPKV